MLARSFRCGGKRVLSPALSALEAPILNVGRARDDDESSTSACSAVLGSPIVPISSPSLSPLQSRNYVTRSRPDMNLGVATALIGVAVMAQAGKMGVQAYNEWSAQEPEEAGGGGSPDSGKSSASNASAGSSNGKDGEKKRPNFFDQFGFGGPSKYYEGGFEDAMTRREAALILGVRESATAKRIKDAHRQILIANHPDTGGSTFIASKVNEAKELLLKGKEKD